MTPFTVRLTNLLAFVLYFFVSVELLKKIRNEFWFVLCGIFILVCNPYLLDFFALARGYGLSIGLMVLSIYKFYQYLTQKNIHHLTYTYISAALAVLANFTLQLLPGIGVFNYGYYFNRIEQKRYFQKNITCFFNHYSIGCTHL
ncbi:MAG: hypothetical protein IPI65_06875 [Bacteroidetes bacterium]|nr:hypothetical protein [Bacteroidota bacterium]